MISKILIANRGEIACRIMKTCKELGISTVAIYSDADVSSMHVKLADESVRVGEASPSSSYLNMSKIIEIAKETNCDAVHPGYGFLAENATFAQLCLENHLIFIGPSPQAIRAMGSKKEAKNLVSQFGVPTIPGYNGTDQSPETLRKEAHKIGFPLLIKAAAGGGGKGMRIVKSESEFLDALNSAKSEALSAFGDDTILLEKYFETSKHIEVQIFGDKHGNLIHFFERECSIQRRYQKIIEEAPSPSISPELREKITQAAINAGKSIHYDNAGTVEFLLDDQNQFYFLEINTRIQVEHPVTEMITKQDLIALQIQVAEGGKLPKQPEQFYGHSIESRIYAEDPYQEFMPRSGTLLDFDIRGNVRVDTGVRRGDQISIFYDPMFAKIISYGSNRNEALRKIIYSLKNSVIQGVVTNQSYLIQILEHEEFQNSNFSTAFLKKHESELLPNFDEMQYAKAVLIYSSLKTPLSLPFMPRGWRSNFYKPQYETIKIKESEYQLFYVWKNDKEITIQHQDERFEIQNITIENQVVIFFEHHKKHSFSIQENHETYEVCANGINLIVKILEKLPDVTSNLEPGAYLSQMPGEVLKVLVNVGDEITVGTSLLVLSSMKMENTIYASSDGLVKEIYVVPGAFVEANSQLIKIEPKNN